jgi:hypothetical protein
MWCCVLKQPLPRVYVVLARLLTSSQAGSGSIIGTVTGTTGSGRQIRAPATHGTPKSAAQYCNQTQTEEQTQQQPQQQTASKENVVSPFARGAWRPGKGGRCSGA